MTIDQHAASQREQVKDCLQAAPNDAAVLDVMVRYFDDLHRGQSQRRRAHDACRAELDRLLGEGRMGYESWLYAIKIIAEDSLEDILVDQRILAERDSARRRKSAANRVDTGRHNR